MVATWNVAAASTYYTKGVEYYLGGKEPQGTWYAPGNDFGKRDGSSVATKDFSALYEGAGEDGRPLISNNGGRMMDRVPAYDITLSAPRSVSLVWAFADAERRAAVEAAQLRATRATLDMLEREASFARRGRGGAKVETVALTAALFQHGESRPAEHSDGRIFADPNLHTHAVVLNLATRADGTVGAIHSKILRDWKMAAGATYHAALAAELNAIGYGLDRFGKNGTFEIAGVDERALEYFSARRNEIESELAEAGTTSGDAAALAAAITKATRRVKDDRPELVREEKWREAAVDQGIDMRGFGEELKRGHAPLDRVGGELLLVERLADLPRQLTENESVVDRRELVRATSAALVGTGLPVERAQDEVERLITSGVIVQIGTDTIGQPKYATPEIIEIERAIIEIAADLAQRPWSRLDQNQVTARTDKHRLSAEQRDAALAATGPESVNIVEGAPGSGKTSTLSPIVEAYRQAGYRVVGAATAWRVAKALQDDLHIDARATASWIEGLNHGQSFLDSRSVLIVDEAGLLSSREMHRLLEEVDRANAKLILVGDRKQLQAIGAGPGLDLVMRSVEASRVDTIVRQREAWAREAITAFGRGEAEAALSAFADHDRLHETEGAKAALARTIRIWRDKRHEHPEQSIALIARTNAQVSAISRAIRQELKRDGQVRGPELSLTVVTPSGHPTEIQLAAGDEFRFLQRHDELGVVNGSIATVIAIRDAQPHGAQTPDICIDAQVNGRLVSFSPRDIADDHGRARLGWAYASTVYASQGMTVDNAIVLLDPGFDRHAVHVAASRARHETHLIVDGVAVDAHLAAERPLDRMHLPHSSTAAARRVLLAERLARSMVKTSTVAVIEGQHVHDLAHSKASLRLGSTSAESPRHAQAPSKPSSARTRELDHEL